MLRAIQTGLLVLFLGIFTVSSVQAGSVKKRIGSDKIRINTRLNGHNSSMLYASKHGLNEIDQPQVFKVLAIRVDFLPDTLETTTGDGSFFTEFPDTMDAEDWIVDPPPHNRQYFQDQLLAARNYFEKFSRGNVILSGMDETTGEGGDIFPATPNGAYTLPYPIWNVNFGDDDDERLSEKLTQLFIDSWQAADESGDLAGIAPDDYDVFVIFHAGAGNEFDTGFDLTPHDIPSVFIDSTDMAEYANDYDGIQLSNGMVIERGMILPEMQRQSGIEIGMMGTVVAQIGHAIGMPHLYQPDTGNPGIGMFGLMDRGFGGFFGIVPTPPSAWMRLHMGWEDTVQVTKGTVHLADIYLPESSVPDSVARLVSVPITDTEYYLLEARQRDPLELEYTIAYDRDGREMRLNDDYSVEVEAGFRVPVRVDNYSFDFPGDGILIWHIDDAVIEARVHLDRIQEDENRRGVDIEEADGSEDIGEDYAFLSAGDGSEYGIIQDCFYPGNDLWEDANRGVLVTFGPDTYPNTQTNFETNTQAFITEFTVPDSIISCRIGNAWLEEGFPVTFGSGQSVERTINPDYDGDGTKDLLFLSQNSLDEQSQRINLYGMRGDGTLLGDEFLLMTFEGVDLNRSDTEVHVVYADIDQDEAEEVFLLLQNRVVRIEYDLTNPTSQIITSLPMFLPTNETGDWLRLMLAGQEDDPVLVGSALVHDDMGNETYSTFILEPDLNGISERIDDFSARLTYGSEWSDTLISTGNDRFNIYTISNQQMVQKSIDPSIGFSINIADIYSVELNGDSYPEIIHSQDVAGTGDNGFRQFFVWMGIADGFFDPRPRYLRSDGSASNTHFMFIDADNDGQYEILPHAPGRYGIQYGINVLEISGIQTEDVNCSFELSAPDGTPNTFHNFIFTDLWGDGEEQVFAEKIGYPDDGTLQRANISLTAKEIRTSRTLDGFPFELNHPESYSVCNVDDDNDLELVVFSIENQLAKVEIYNIPNGGSARTRILSQMNLSIRNAEILSARNTGHIWERPNGGSLPTTSGLDKSQAYIWPNPVIDDIAHVRFWSGKSGTAEVKVFDQVGRLLKEQSMSYQGGMDNELVMDCSDLPSGVYTARLEAGGEHKMIRFAVVQ
ncbi:hypothetical protein K8I28_00460 [bacterium]|nr:hypothetical protein [bacterium]